MSDGSMARGCGVLLDQRSEGLEVYFNIHEQIQMERCNSKTFDDKFL